MQAEESLTQAAEVPAVTVALLVAAASEMTL